MMEFLQFKDIQSKGNYSKINTHHDTFFLFCFSLFIFMVSM